MTPEQWQQISDLFDAALKQSPDQREAFVQRAAGGDKLLSERVCELIALDDGANQHGFLSPPGRHERSLSDCSQNTLAMVGKRIGPYQIEKWLASGGMGSVYLARRVDAYEQAVAIKLMRFGFDDSGLKRFHAERQTLACLDHPNIAKLLDGGATADGIPYYVMEYVEGERIDHFCDKHEATTAERLRLFQAVCCAVEHAHVLGIVHRDLKPANILVSTSGVPKLTDFGLAKTIAAGENPKAGPEESGLTKTGQILGTPSYMAPERAAGRRMESGKLADVYSLGAILYELLTGRPPFKGSSWRETLEQVCTQEPLSPRRWQPKLPRDLEVICLKCLEKDPARRYAAVAELNEDLRRFAAGDSIVARPVSRLGRAWRWSRRNPRVASLAAALVIALVAGFTSITFLWQLAEARGDLARRKQIEAEEQRRKANDHFDLAFNFIGEHYKYALKNPDVRKQQDPELLQRALEHYRELIDQQTDPEKLTQLRDRLAHTHWLFIRHYRAIGNKAATVNAAKEMLAVYERLAQENLESPYYQTRYGVALEEVAFANNDSPEARSYYDAATALREKLALQHPDYPEIPAQLGFSYHNLGANLAREDRFEEAARWYEKSCEQWLKDPRGVAHRHLADACRDLAEIYERLKLVSKALGAWQRAQRSHEIMATEQPDNLDNQKMLAAVIGEMARLQGQLGQMAAAIESRQQARAVLELVYQKERSRREWRDAQELLAKAYDAVAQDMIKAGRAPEAAESHEKARRLRQQMEALP